MPAALHCAKTAEQVEILFAVKMIEGPRHNVLGGGPDLPMTREEIFLLANAAIF